MTQDRIVTLCARGTEPLLVAELATFGLGELVPGRAQVSGVGDYASALRACMWSRVASRVLWPVVEVNAMDPDQLYASLKSVEFEDHLAEGGTFAIDCTFGLETGPGTPFHHSQFVTLRVKDAIVDRLREVRGTRPDVNRDYPDVLFHVHVASGKAELSIDLAGEALHRRGYRNDARLAPLKENLAAALLMQMDWPRRAEAGEPLCDPMCGSGTFLIEAAMMLGDRAPGLLRQRWGFQGWAQHEDDVWLPIDTEARERARAGLAKLDAGARFFGYDGDPQAVAAATRNAQIAGLEGRLVVEVGSVAELRAPAPQAGLVITNPPYGERLGEAKALEATYRELGDTLKRNFPGWTAGVFTQHGPLVGAIGLRPTKRDIFWNGAIECRLLTIPISTEQAKVDGPAWRTASAHSEMFANRVEKNWKHLGKWARRENVSSYRVYDADLPEYAVAVDLYVGTPEHESEQSLWAHVQEYAPPATVDPGKAERRLADVMMRLPDVLKIDPSQVVLKVRKRQRGSTQYEAQGRRGQRMVVEEGGHRFWVNLHDYLDTGLFLDQRILRKMVGESARGRTFLNLFCYTGSATVYAHDAKATTSVDLSNTYLAWAEDNFALNQLDPRNHRVVKDDCLNWMAAAVASGAKYDVIFLAPPTFSNSKGMEGVLDLQRDHGKMLSDCAQLLSPDGELYFVNHFRRFKMEAPEMLTVEELTRKTLPPDYARDERFHKSYRLRLKP